MRMGKSRRHCTHRRKILSDSMQEAQGPLQNTCATLASPQDAIRAKMNKVEGSVSRLHQNHRQDYWWPSLFWEPELESLHHAINMKNEQVHEL